MDYAASSSSVAEAIPKSCQRAAAFVLINGLKIAKHISGRVKWDLSVKQTYRKEKEGFSWNIKIFGKTEEIDLQLWLQSLVGMGDVLKFFAHIKGVSSKNINGWQN